MHEVALMQNLLRVVEEAAEKQGGGKVKLVHLRIGEMAGVNTESLRFAFQVLSPGTRVEGGELEFEKIPLRIKCLSCGEDHCPPELTFRCPRCGGANMEIISGREMDIEYIMMDEEGDSPRAPAFSPTE
ncbi:MAG: hydrogenase maturation nickel metallochaperone HypA [Candidatus Krumholzibacteriota bacterium]|nr:hydrogenase maturation nickel metallochaperone HypA [Candidatus Krumholzibacteriota bacterium]